MTVRSRLQFMAQALPAPQPLRSWEAYWQFADSRRAATAQPPVPRPTGHNPDVQAFARVDDGRWIADCPWGCGAAFNLPEGADILWCTECAGGGWGNAAALVWPESMDRLTVNLESLPATLQDWPCAACRPRLAGGAALCVTCAAMQGRDA